MTTDRRVVIDFLPESARVFDDGWAVVAVDILRATTTAVTIAWSGRRCLPVGSLEEARETAAQLRRPLLVGELGGDLPEGFDLQNSPCTLESLGELERPVVLLSSSGTRIFGQAAAAAAVYAACLRNLTAQVAHLAAHHPRVAMIGAGSKGEFRREDQLGCAWMAAALMEAGYRPDGERTLEAIERWRDAPVEACAEGRSAEYLRRTGQLADLDFVLSRVDDVDAVFAFVDGELRQVPS
jgi:2-phosphosulfolactate phosphatase